MQRLEISGAVRLICRSLGVKGLNRHDSALFESQGTASQDSRGGINITQKRQNIMIYVQGRRLRVASGATAPDIALEGAPRFRPMSLSNYILR